MAFSTIYFLHNLTKTKNMKNIIEAIKQGAALTITHSESDPDGKKYYRIRIANRGMETADLDAAIQDLDKSLEMNPLTEKDLSLS